MDSKEFNDQHKAIITKHNVCFRDDCDLRGLVSGMNYYENTPMDDGKFLVHLTGIYYIDGGMGGDLEGYLILLDSELTKIKRD